MPRVYDFIQQGQAAHLVLEFIRGQDLLKLLEANNRGTIAAQEKSDLDKYLRVGQFLDLMQAKARVSLAEAGIHRF